MNNAMIRYILGQVLRIEGILMLLPCIVAVIYREKEGFVILGVAALCFFLERWRPSASQKATFFI